MLDSGLQKKEVISVGTDVVVLLYLPPAFMLSVNKKQTECTAHNVNL